MFFVISRPIIRLPFTVAAVSQRIFDAHSSKHSLIGTAIDRRCRMNNRAIDLRTGFSQAIFRISSVACQLLRQFLLKRSFIEVHTPCLLEETHRHHNESFELNYFGPSQTLRSRTSTTNNSVFWAVMIVPSQLAQPLGNFTEIPISIWN